VRGSISLSGGLILVLACSLVAPTSAPASCAAVVVVEGSLLFGVSIEHRPGRVPARGARLRAIEPSCGDDTDDRRVTVTKLAGMPARLAVAPEGTDTSLYVAEGSLIALASHPLHRAWYAGTSRPSFRRGESCREAEPLTGTVSHPGADTRLHLATPDGDRTVRVDASSRIANRPAYQPVLAGQRLRLRMLQCGPHRVAHRIRFSGATIRAERYDIKADDDRDTLPVLIVAAAAVLIAIPLIFRLIPTST
jgi:hypothetical protein